MNPKQAAQLIREMKIQTEIQIELLEFFKHSIDRLVAAMGRVS